jgi:polyisoprenyl-phosphate glycosyltransferase
MGEDVKLGIVVPCYNEEAVLAETAKCLLALRERLSGRGQIDDSSRIWFVDDGSNDSTWKLIQELVGSDIRICGIKLSRNRGHQNALLAGLFTADGDALVSIDADLQDDIDVIEQMVGAYSNGADIVYGARARRDTDSVFKKISAELFYRILALMGVESVFNHADFRLMSRRAIDGLRTFKEINVYLRGIVPLLGYKSAIVHYARRERFAGETKYPLRKMIALALDAVTSFSVTPLRFVMFAGLAIFFVTLALSGWILWVRFFTDHAVPGWASTVLPMYFLGGVQILCLAVISEYLGKIYSEIKSRPRYIIEEVIGKDRV